MSLVRQFKIENITVQIHQSYHIVVDKTFGTTLTHQAVRAKLEAEHPLGLVYYIDQDAKPKFENMATHVVEEYKAEKSPKSESSSWSYWGTKK